MEIRKIILKIRGIGWLKTLLRVAVIGAAIAFGYSLGAWDLNILISVVGTLVAIIAVILIYLEMNLKNRPFLCIISSNLEERTVGKPTAYQIGIKNCGVLPAKGITWEIRVLADGKEVTKSRVDRPGRAEIYPDQDIGVDSIHNLPQGNVSYHTRIDYTGAYGKTYWYAEVRKIHPVTGIIYLDSVISR